MTVYELIDLLRNCKQKAQVKVVDEDGNDFDFELDHDDNDVVKLRIKDEIFND